MAKKTFTKEIDSLMRQSSAPTILVGDPQEKKPQEGKRPVGRPRRKISSSQNGLPLGETRMTFLVSEDQQEKLKYIAYRERMSIKQIMSEAIQDYINKYEGLMGEIDLNA